jgi:hypothetical protein
MLGRAYLWGLGANGQTGVENVLDLLRMGLDSALLGLGHSSISQLSRNDFLIPEGFEVALGYQVGAPEAVQEVVNRCRMRHGSAPRNSFHTKKDTE